MLFPRHNPLPVAGFALVILAAFSPLPAQQAEPDPASPTTEVPTMPDAAEEAPATMTVDPEAFTDEVQVAAGMDAWRDKVALVADIEFECEGEKPFAGTLTMMCDFSGVRLESDDDGVAVWDGQGAWVAPDTDAIPRARFHLMTLPYFVAAPFRIVENGTRIDGTGLMTWIDSPTPSMRLAFNPGVRMSADDWFLLYVDPETSMMKGLAFSVAGANNGSPATAEPCAIVYDNWTTVDGVEVPTSWTLHKWARDEGASGALIGRGSLSDIHFEEPDGDAFTKPEGAIADAKPTT